MPTAPSPAPAATPLLLTREHVLRALRKLEREGLALPPSTVYELVYRGRRYPPRPVAELAHRLATRDATARWPLPAGTPTNAVFERLDFTISTKRPVLGTGSAHDSEETAQQQAEALYTGLPELGALAAQPEATLPALVAAEPEIPYTPPQSYSRAEALTELFISESEANAALAGLQRRRNLLLQGPPGTGKTFLARRLAWLLLRAKDDARIELVQFHPSYGYEDFILGFRPDAEGRFHLVPGALLLLCQRAAADPTRPYFLLIDEVNRGNVPRIFGELLLLLEADKRGPAHALRLPYAPPEAARFFVPENLYVIGTLNLADRSLSALDYALRRRFAFVELRPQFGATLQQFLVARQVPEKLAAKLCTRLTALNQTIADDPELGPDFAVGHSYFCQPPAKPTEMETWYRQLIEQEIGPLLADYWREQPATAAAQVRKLLA
jgi:5-methylcytosine-specific restriction protein B